jgi:hypothetical protein
MMIIVLAFLLNNGLMNRAGQLIFFIDGAADLHLAIENLFVGLLSFKIIQGAGTIWRKNAKNV